MQFLKDKWNYFANYFVHKVEENKDRKVTKYEIYFEQVYKTLSWEDNTYTLGIFCLINFLFWLIVLYELRPLGILFSTILILFVLNTYLETRNYSTYHLQYEEELGNIWNCFQEFQTGLMFLKKESPSTFCLGSCIFFLTLSVVAKNMSSYLLIYIFILEIFFIPLFFKIIPEAYSISFKRALRSLSNVKGALAEEELIPFIANKDFFNEDADLDSLLTDKTADSATNSLASGISTMPSYLDVADTQEVIEEDDLIPNRADPREISSHRGELSSDSDSEHREMAFDSTHFNGDSSSEEEKLIGKGLKFTDVTDEVVSKTTTSKINISGMLSNLATMSNSLLTAAISSNINSTPVERKNSSSDSEFEIINSDDVKE